MPTRVTTPAARRTTEPTPVRRADTTAPQAAPAATTPRRRDDFDFTKPRADGSLAFGSRAGGPGEVSMSKSGELLLNGKKNGGAAIELARLIETGLSPFAHATDAQREGLMSKLGAQLEPGSEPKPATGTILNRSAAATLLLSIARTGNPKTSKAALETYVKAMGKEPNPKLQRSMLVNLEAARLPVPRALAATIAQAREKMLPSRPPYDEWFKGQAKPKMEVRHYVMDEFWKQELNAWKDRGFKVTKESPKAVELEGTLTDPTGKNPPVTVKVRVENEDSKVLRDLNDPKVNMILYSGHSQYGGIVDSSLAAAPSKMDGTKLVQMYNCRGKQNQGDLLAKYPQMHLTSTFSSAYGDDDVQVLDQTLKMIGSRGSYGDINKGLRAADLIQPKSNYMLPDDPRNMMTRDDDRDGIHDNSPIGADRFFDPATARATGGIHSFSPGAIAIDPQTLSGNKIDHAVGYANTTFYYFSEENRASPIAHKKSDTFLPGGYFTAPAAEKVRVTESTKDGTTWFKVEVNSKFADRSRETIAAMVMMEMQIHLAEKDHGKATGDDKLRALVMVAGYADMYMEYGDVIDDLLKNFGKEYGIKGVSYEVLYEAMKKDGHDGTATVAALDYLKKHGVSAEAR